MVETAHRPTNTQTERPTPTDRPSQTVGTAETRRDERRRRLRKAAGATAATVAGVAVAVVVVRSARARRRAQIAERVPPSLITAWRTYEMVRDHAAKRAA